ncbi:MAG TPA: deoxyribonuclease IV [Syntrophomonadaceae bacterium]|nr:deoxyribonuclease IV [Syntrophomonadaceae bacterium]
MILNPTRIGAHLPIGKGLKYVADEAVARGLEALQIFVRNPRGGVARKLSEEEISYFNTTMHAHDIKPVVVHIPYTCNPAAVKDDVYKFALQVVQEELERCSTLGADYLVLHPGSYTSSNLEQGIKRIVTLLNQVLDHYTGETTLLLETMAGRGTEIGRNFEEINTIMQAIHNKRHIGVCIDTCHLFAAGYDVSSTEGIEDLLAAIDHTCGREAIKILHSNDSQTELGSRRDRHAHIGEGFIGESSFRKLLHHEFFSKLPFILETPYEELDKDIEILKSARQQRF